MRLPLFPLNTVLFPGGRLALRVFERRYLDMVRDCLRNDTGFVIVLIAEGREAGEPAVPHGTGVLVRIVDWDSQPDGLLGLVVEAGQRVRITEWWTASDGLLKGRLQPLPEVAASALPPEHQDLGTLLARLLERFGKLYPAAERELENAGWVAGRLAELLPLSPALKQTLLEMDLPNERLALLRDGLRQLGLAAGGSSSRQ